MVECENMSDIGTLMISKVSMLLGITSVEHQNVSRLKCSLPCITYWDSSHITFMNHVWGFQNWVLYSEWVFQGYTCGKGETVLKGIQSKKQKT